MSSSNLLNLAGLISRHAAASSGQPAITFEGAGTRPDEVRTYAQLWRGGQRFAHALDRKSVV